MFYHNVEFKNNKKKTIRHIVDDKIEKNNTNVILNSLRHKWNHWHDFKELL